MAGSKSLLYVPKEVKLLHIMKIIHADTLATTTGDTLSGETNLFSTYLIAYKDAETPTPTPKPVPKTGDKDHPGLWILLMLIGIAGLTVIGTLKVSRKRK